MYKTDYEDKHDLGVYISSGKSKLSQSVNLYHWPILLLNEIELLQFKVILKHAYFHEKGYKILFCSLLKVFHMFSIIIWYDKGCNAKVICIKCNICGKKVTYQL